MTKEEREVEAQKMDEKKHCEVSEDHLKLETINSLGFTAICMDPKLLDPKAFAVYAALPRTPGA